VKVVNHTNDKSLFHSTFRLAGSDTLDEGHVAFDFSHDALVFHAFHHWRNTLHGTLSDGSPNTLGKGEHTFQLVHMSRCRFHAFLFCSNTLGNVAISTNFAVYKVDDQFCWCCFFIICWFAISTCDRARLLHHFLESLGLAKLLVANTITWVWFHTFSSLRHRNTGDEEK